MGNTNSMVEGGHGSQIPNGFSQNTSIPPPPPRQAAPLSFQAQSSSSNAQSSNSFHQQNISPYNPSSTGSGVSSTEANRNLDQFFQMLEHVRLLERQRDDIMLHKNSLEAQLADENISYQNEVQAIDQHCESVIRKFQADEQQKCEFEKARHSIAIQKELEDRIVHLNTCVIPEREAMSAEDLHSSAIESILRQYPVAFKFLKVEYTEKFKTSLKISKAEYSKTIQNFQEEREAEYDALSSTKKRKSQGSGILSWFSPSPKKLRGADNSDSSDSDDVSLSDGEIDLD